MTVDQATAAECPAGVLTLQDLRATYGQAGSKYVTLKGVEIHYMDEGSGPAILMIHGASSTLKTYDVIAEILKDRYRVIRYDVAPSGLSGPVSDAVLKDLVPEEVPELLLTALGVRSATVVGVSSGGTTGFFFAARRPDMVERLVLSNTPSGPMKDAPWTPSKALAEQTAANKEDPFKSRAYWDAFFDFFAGEPERISAAKRDQYFDMNRRIEANPIALAAKVADQDVAKANAAKVTCPVLLVWGARDPLLVSASADVLAAMLKNAPVSKVMMPDAGHYPPLECPERFANIVAAYIADVTPVKPVAPDPADR